MDGKTILYTLGKISRFRIAMQVEHIGFTENYACYDAFTMLLIYCKSELTQNYKT
jgi:hypothetical protein